MSKVARIYWDILSGTPAPEAWWLEWEELCRASLESHPGLTVAMIVLLVRHFHSGSLVFATLRKGGAACLKTILGRNSLGRWEVFCPPQALVGPVVFDRGAMAELARLPPIALLDWKIDFPYQDPRFSWITAAHPLHAQTTASWDTVSISAPHGFEAYWALRPRDLRDNIARRQRKAKRDQLEFEPRTVTDPGAIGAAVTRYCALESRGWKGDAGTALSVDNEQGRFYRELMLSGALRGEASVSEFYVGDRLVASRLLLSSGKRHVILKTTYDEELKSYSVGMLQLHHILQRLLTDPAASVELYTHASAQQLQWATSAPRMSNVSVFRNDWWHRLWQLRRAHPAGDPA